MITILSSADDVWNVEWKSELRRFLQADAEKNGDGPVKMNAECPYCGRQVDAEDLSELFFMGKICKQCLQERIWTKKAATELTEQCFKNLYYIYGIRIWKKVKVKLKFRWWAMKNYQFPTYGSEVKYRKRWKLFWDKLSVARGLPVLAAERAVAMKLLEQYMEEQLLKAEKAEQETGTAGLKREEIRGLCLWCTIHYLYIVRSHEYAKRYEGALSQEDRDCYQVWRQENLGTPMNNNYLQLEQVICRSL